MANQWTWSGELFTGDPADDRIRVTAIWDEPDDLGQRFTWRMIVPELTPGIRSTLLTSAEAARDEELARRTRNTTLAGSMQTFSDANQSDPP